MGASLLTGLVAVGEVFAAAAGLSAAGLVTVGLAVGAATVAAPILSHRAINGKKASAAARALGNRSFGSRAVMDEIKFANSDGAPTSRSSGVITCVACRRRFSAASPPGKGTCPDNK
jgi:hypothetical protein